MPALIKVFFWGLLISFLGTLPMGTLNIMAMQIGIQESIKNAIYFVFGTLLVEMIYVRISLIGINWIQKQERVMKVMQWITLCIIVLLAAGSIHSAINSENQVKSVVLQNRMHRTLLGMLMCAINPVQIPFWFGWSTVLFSKKILSPINKQYNFYIFGIGFGTFIGNCVFIFGGKWLVQRIQHSEAYLNWVIGIIFSFTAIIQFYNIMRHKTAVDKIQDFKKKENLLEKLEGE